MAGHEETTTATAVPRSVELPEETVIQDNPLQKEISFTQEAAKSLIFDGSQYDFPEGTTDEEMLEFVSNLPAEEEEVVVEGPQEPLRETEIIKKDEGVRRDKEGNHVSYIDTEKHLTGGRGHLLTDEEKELYPKGTIIPEGVVDAWFDTDMKEADTILIGILEDKAVHVPDDVYDILLNMTFNLGKGKVPRGAKKGTGILSFKDMWAAIEVGDWQNASIEMEDSKWFKQVKSRGVRLVNRMAAIPANTREEAPEQASMTPSKGGLFEDENGKLFMVDEQGNKTEV